MKRSGFTMIELIFVIVILGILAAVAIPKLAATRDDAQIAKAGSNVKTMTGEISAYTVSQGVAPTTDANLTAASNTFSEGFKSGYYDTAAFATGRTIRVWDKATGVTGRTQCSHVDVNSSNIMLHQDTNATVVCRGINSMNPEGNVSIGGQGVVY